MKTIFLRDDHRKRAAELEGQFADPSHVLQTIGEDAKVIAPDGIITALLLCNVIPPALHKLAYELWKPVDGLPDNRATAVGSRSLPRLKKDGTLSERRGVPKKVLKVVKERGTRTGSIGYLDGHKTPLTRKHPEMLLGNRRLIELVDDLYKQYLPTFYAKQQAVIEKAPHWRLWHTVLSTIYLAKRFRTAYHRDGNLPGVMTALMPMGNFTGAELVIPRWKIAFPLKPGDLLLFDAEELHGNLPIRGERLSAIFFCPRRIADCDK